VLLKNEATDLLDIKGLALGRIRNEATVLGSEGGRRKSKKGKSQRAKGKSEHHGDRKEKPIACRQAGERGKLVAEGGELWIRMIALFPCQRLLR